MYTFITAGEEPYQGKIGNTAFFFVNLSLKSPPK